MGKMKNNKTKDKNEMKDDLQQERTEVIKEAAVADNKDDLDRFIDDRTKKNPNFSDLIADPSGVEQHEDEEAAKHALGEELLKNPEVMALMQRLKDISIVVNQVAGFLNGKAVLPEEVSHEDHAKFLATRYVQDIVFLLERLGVLNGAAQQQQQEEDEPSLIVPSTHIADEKK